jgi:hypothetical protein
LIILLQLGRAFGSILIVEMQWMRPLDAPTYFTVAIDEEDSLTRHKDTAA